MSAAEGVTAADAVAVLNRIHVTDPTVLPALIDVRVPANDLLVEDPTVQVGPVGPDGKHAAADDPDAHYAVGLLGILNGIFGTNEKGRGHIEAWRDDDGTLLHFAVDTPETETERCAREREERP